MQEKSNIRYVLPCSIDLNSASDEELRRLRGIGAHYAKRIIEGRPYLSINALVTKASIPGHVVERIRDQCTLGQPFCNENRGMRYDGACGTDTQATLGFA